MKKYNLWIFGVIFIFIVYLISAFFYEKNEEQKRLIKIQEENNRQNLVAENFYKSKLFGIQINDKADLLLFTISDIPPTYGNTDKVYEKNGMLKNTEKFFLTGSGYSVNLNPYINDIAIEKNLNSCFELFKKLEMETREKDCVKPINKNQDFEEYYIKYHPYGYKIWSIIGKLKQSYKDNGQCIKNLKPYANVISSNISKNINDERISIVDKFYPTEKKPIIYFNYKSGINNEDLSFLTIEGHCQNNSAFVSLNAPFLRPNPNEFNKIENMIRENKKIIDKENFEENVKEIQKSIDTKGLK